MKEPVWLGSTKYSFSPFLPLEAGGWIQRLTSSLWGWACKAVAL